MKIRIEKVRVPCETEVLVKCSERADDRTEKLIRQLESYVNSVAGYKQGEAHRVSLQDVFYIEYVEEKTFLYMEHDVYETRQKLYEWEEQLKGTSFVRISKSTILNIDKLKSVRFLLSGKLEDAMKNGEKEIVNRHYVSDFRKKFGI